MKIKLLCVGKTNEKNLSELIQVYIKRIPSYIGFELVEVPDIKNRAKLSKELIKEKEAELILSKISSSDVVILLDDKGKQFSSIEWSKNIEDKMNRSIKQLVYVVGGAYGFHDSIYQRANEKISFSKMTFTHQMIRLLFVEQLYRVFSILQGKPYHHE